MTRAPTRPANNDRAPAFSAASLALAAALAEMRSARRLVRTWLFTAIALGLPTAYFIARSFEHDTTLNPLSQVTAPRYAMPAAGLLALVAFLACTLFLAFDMRGRDRRERLADVLDARPASNLVLLGARLAGVVATVWVPTVLLVVLMQTVGWLGRALDLPLAPVEPLSALAFLFVDTLPLFVFFGSLVVFLATLLGNRWLVAAMALALLCAWLWALGDVPLRFARPLFGHAALFYNSDILPRLADVPTLVHRLSLVVAALGLIALAASAQPRPDQRRGRTAALGAALVAAAAAGIWALAWQAQANIDQRTEWRASHVAAQQRSGGRRADIEHVQGTVDIAPGEALTLDIAMRVRPTAGDSLSFSFNPGLAVDALLVDGGQAAFEHRDGLLAVALPPPAKERVVVSLRARGTPLAHFAYLDATVSPQDRVVLDEFDALGLEAAVFDSRYVALMPATRWLPAAGANVDCDDPGLAPRDFFTADIEVRVPAGWLVAGPGRRRAVAGASEEARFRFQPAAPVPAFALLASRFARRAVAVAGVELEVLLHPDHVRNFAFLEDVAGILVDRVEELLGAAERAGLPYPYRAFALVEAPATLRGYGGGWRLDTARALPGMLLMREHGFPTAALDRQFRNKARFEDREGGLAGAKVAKVEDYLNADLTGGALFSGVARNFVLFQIGAKPAVDASLDRNMEAAALEVVAHELATLVLSGRPGYFSAYVFSDAESFLRLQSRDWSFASGGRVSPLTAVANRPAVWDRALGAPLAALDPTDDPGVALNVLAFKGRAAARTLLDGLGRQGAAALLAELRERHRGAHFDIDDFNAAGRAIGVDLGALLGDWLRDTALPGFLASPVAVERIADDERGRPRYQTRLHIRNDEPAPGVLRLRYLFGERHWTSNAWRSTRPVRIAGNTAVEVGFVTRSPPAELRVAPYLALNRRPLELPLPKVSRERATVNAEPFVGQRPSDWRPPPVAGIVVDDLDPGFAIARDEGSAGGFRLAAVAARRFEPQGDLDQGLPEYHSWRWSQAGWRRQELGTSWGKYRRTVARSMRGDGRARVVFAAQLPSAGAWRLGYHMPTEPRSKWMRWKGGRVSPFHKQGRYDIAVEFGGERRAVEFDAHAAEVGWNALGEFDLPAGEVRVLVSDRTDGEFVMADAIRWRPVPTRGPTKGRSDGKS